ncbi:MAG TPA: hypothetical protein VK031_04770 [Tissierellaceae bacterium]|nr:hypothetical protein [Tissierellaceae bacterium]
MIKKAIKGVLSVKPLDNDQEVKIRYDICKQCEFYDAESDKCTICKCFMEIKTGLEVNINPIKLRKEVTHCPKGYWGDKEIANLYRERDGLDPLD